MSERSSKYLNKDHEMTPWTFNVKADACALTIINLHHIAKKKKIRRNHMRKIGDYKEGDRIRKGKIKQD